MRVSRSTSWCLMVMLALAGAVIPAAGAEATGKAADRLVADGSALYDKGDYGGALLKFEEAVKQGAEGGELFYRMGYCYRAVREDIESSRAYYAKAQPLLEASLKDGSRVTLTTYYHLAAIAYSEIPDPARLAAVARGAIVAVDTGKVPKPTDGQGLSELGRLYGFAGENGKAAEQLEKAVAAFAKDPAAAGRPAYLFALSGAAEAATARKDWTKAADYLRKAIELDPARDELRASLALNLFRADEPEEAIEVWRKIGDPQFIEERTYLMRVAQRYRELGMPAAKDAPGKDEDLTRAIVEAARAYAEIRTKDDAAAKAAADKWTEEKKKEMETRKTDPAQRARERAAIDAIPPEERTAEQQLAAMGIYDVMPTPPPPEPTPERLAAERKFVALVAELVRRGQPLRDFALTNGLAPVLFR